MSKKNNLLGQKFERGLVIEEIQTTNGRGPKWKCLCDCGKEFTVNSGYALTSGHTKSCGCLAKEESSKRLSAFNANKPLKYGNPRLATANKIYKERYSDGNLTFEQFLELSQKNCRWCDAMPANNQKIYDKKSSSQNYIDNCEFIYNGLDRRNNNLPHNIDNLDPCCKICNYAKRERTVNDFKKWIIEIGSNLRSKGLI